MLGTTLIDGVECHTQNGEILLDEHNEPIPSYVCICAAYCSHECCCGAWDRPRPEDNFNEE